jgi:hypothetical protein
MLEMVIREEIELVEEVSNVDATQRIHLREGENTRETTWLSAITSSFFVDDYLRKLFSFLVWCKPTDIDDLVILVKIADWHRHVIVRRNNLIEVSIGSATSAVQQTSWKSSLNRLLSSSAYFSNNTRRKLSRIVTEYPQPYVLVSLNS